MKLPWFNSTPTAAPARSGAGLTSTYAADRAEALAAHRKAAAEDLEKRMRAISEEIERAKQTGAQSVVKAEAEAEATRKRVGEVILAEFYEATGELVRAYLTEPTRGVALKLRDAFLHFRQRGLVEIGVNQGTEYMGLAFASVLVAEAPATVTAFADPEVMGSVLSVSSRCVDNPFQWEDEIEQLVRLLAVRVTDFAARGYQVTAYHRDMFQEMKWSPTYSDRHHAIAAVNAAEAARKQAQFAATYVAPEVRRRPGHAAEVTE